MKKILVSFLGIFILFLHFLVELSKKEIDCLLSSINTSLGSLDGLDVILVGFHSSFICLDDLPEVALLDACESSIGHQWLVLASGEIAVSGGADTWVALNTAWVNLWGVELKALATASSTLFDLRLSGQLDGLWSNEAQSSNRDDIFHCFTFLFIYLHLLCSFIGLENGISKRELEYRFLKFKYNIAL